MFNQFFGEEGVKRVSKWTAISLMLLSAFLLVKIIGDFKRLPTVGREIYPQSTISVSGTGEVYAIPDIATFNFSVIELGSTVVEAQEKADQKMSKSLAVIRQLGVEDKDIKTTSYNVYGSFLNGKKDFRLISLSNTISGIVSSVATFFIIIYTQNPLLIVIGYLVTSFLTSAFYYFYTIKKYQPNEKFEEGSLAMGKHFSVMNAFTIIAQNIDKILIFHFLGGAPLAIYSFAQAPVNQILGLLKLAGPIYAPKILAKTKEENKKELPKKFWQIFSLMIIPTIAYIVLIPFFYKIFFPQYAEAIIYSQFYALVLLTFGKKFIAIPMPIYFSKKIQYQMSIINPTIDILPKLILLYYFGLAGAIAAILVSNVLTTTVSFYYFKRMRD